MKLLGRIATSNFLLLLVLWSCVADCSASTLLDGDWKLNAHLSDDLDELFFKHPQSNQQKKQPRRRDQKQQREHPSDKGRSNGKRGRRGGSAPGMGMGMVFTQFLPRSALLTIKQRPAIIELHYGYGDESEEKNDRVIHLSAAGQAVSAKGKPNKVERTIAIAGWEDDRLYVESTTEQNIKIFEIYYLRADGIQLIIETEIKNPLSAPLKIRRVFDRMVKIM